MGARFDGEFTAKLLAAEPRALGVSISLETGAIENGCEKFFDPAGNSIARCPPAALRRVALTPAELGDIAPVHRRVQVTVGRTNFGLRVFNRHAVLSAPHTLPDRQGVLVLPANFTDDPAENGTLPVRGRWSKATLACPGCAPRALQLYPVLEATAAQIDSLPAFAAVRVEQ